MNESVVATPQKGDWKKLPKGRRPWAIAAILLLVVGGAGTVAVFMTGEQDPPIVAVGEPPVVQLPGDAPQDIQITVKPSDYAGAPVTSLGDFTTVLGGPFTVQESTFVEGSKVVFPVSEVQVDSGGDPVDTDDLFIAMFNTDLQIWVPLPTIYDAAASTVSAVAPHFSDVLFGKLKKGLGDLASWEVEGIKIVGDNGGRAFGDTGRAVQAFAADPVGQTLAWLAPEQEDAQCASQADGAYEVTFNQEALSGCVNSAESRYTLSVENTSLIPFVIDLSGVNGATPTIPSAGDQDLASTLISWIETGAHRQFIGGHHVGRVELTPELAHTDWSTRVTPEIPALLFGTMFSLWSALPMEEEFSKAVERIEPAMRTFVQEHSSYTTEDLVLELRRLLTAPGNNTPEAVGDFLGVLQTGYECGQEAGALLTTAAAQGISSDLFSTMLQAAHKCAGDALINYGKDRADGVTDYANVIGGASEMLDGIGKQLINSTRAGVQFARMGPGVMQSSMSVIFHQDRCLTVGNCGDLPIVPPTTPPTTAPAPSPGACDPSTPAPAIDDTAQYAIHLDLDGYYRPHYRSEPTPVCGAQTLVISYANSENATSSPERIDIRVYDTTTQQWKVVQTFDPHDPQDGTGSQPYVPTDNSCQSDCIHTAHVTDGDIDFLVQGGNATLANGLTVISEKDGVWRMVPFLDKPPSTGSTNYVPAATLSGNEIHVDLNDCKPDCATGGHTTVAYTYNKDLQGFEGALVGDTGANAASGDLGLTVPIANRSCTGQYLTLIGSSVDPNHYQDDVQSFLGSHPGSSYLVTDQSCGSLVSSVNGNRVYAAYLGPFATAAQACAAGAAAGSGSYVKVLNNITSDAALITC